MINPLLRFFSVAALLMASTFGTLAASTGEARAETRTLDMYFTHTGKRRKFTFKKNGKYVRKGLRTFNNLVRDHRRKEATKMDPKLLDLVWEIYQELGTRKPIHIVSGYRSPKTNAALRRRGRKVANKSQHMRGKALDWFVPGVSVAKQRAAALRAHGGGVGYYRNSFVHTDTARVRHWPRMSRRQLAKVFPRGRTIHVPSNGKPLRGYKVAAANLKKGLRYNGKRKKYRSSGGKSLLAKIFTKDDAAETKTEAPAKVVKKTAPAAKPAPAAPVAETVVASAASQKGTDLFAADAKAALDAAAKVAPVALARNAYVPATRPGSDANVAAPTLVAALDPARPARRPAGDLVGTPSALESFSVAELKARKGNAVRTGAIAYARPDVEVPGEAAVEALAAGRPVVPAPAAPSVELAMADPAPKPSRDLDALNRRIRSSLDARPANAVRPSVSERLAAIRPAPLRRSEASSKGSEIAAPKIDEAIITAALQRSRSAEPVRSAADAAKLRLPLAFKRERKADVTFVRLSGETIRVPFAIGNLYGRSVKSWATARTTRRGLFATLRAPAYKQSTQLPAPNAVYAVGFQKQGRLSTGRFTGSAKARVVFQEVAQLN